MLGFNRNQSAVEVNVKSLRKLKKQRDELDTQISKLEDAIKGIMEASNQYEYSGDDWKVTWNMVSSNRFNQKLFKENNPDLYSQYQSITESRRFLLS